MPVWVVCGECLTVAQCQDASKIEAFGVAFLAGEGNVHRCAKRSQHGARCRAIGARSLEERREDGEYMARAREYKMALRATISTHLKRAQVMVSERRLESLLTNEVERVLPQSGAEMREEGPAASSQLNVETTDPETGAEKAEGPAASSQLNVETIEMDDVYTQGTARQAIEDLRNELDQVRKDLEAKTQALKDAETKKTREMKAYGALKLQLEQFGIGRVPGAKGFNFEPWFQVQRVRDELRVANDEKATTIRTMSDETKRLQSEILAMEVLHHVSVQREHPEMLKTNIRARMNDVAVAEGELEGLVAACHDCNQWHEQFSKDNPKATLDDVRKAHKSLSKASGQHILVANSQPTQEEDPQSPEDEIESIPSPSASEQRRHTDVLVATKERQRNYTRNAHERQLASKMGFDKMSAAEKRKAGYMYEVGTGWVDTNFVTRSLKRAVGERNKSTK